MSEPATAASPAPRRLDLGEILLETTSLTEEQLAQARAKQAESGRRLTDVLIADKQALLQSLSAAAPAATSDSWVGRIPMAGQMVLGFILPFALAFVAIPLESFIHSARSIGGSLFADLVRILGFVLHVLGNFVRHFARALLHFYDLLVVLPLMVEHLVRSLRGGAGRPRSHPRPLDSTGELKP